MLLVPWLETSSPAFRLMIATSWLAPDSWREHQDRAILQAADGKPDWSDYLRLIAIHRTPALAWAALKRAPGLTIPDRVQKELKKRSDSCHFLAVRHAKLMAQFLLEFAQAEIPVLPLKGPLLSLELYGDIGLRHSRDLDLLVPLEKIPAATACLQNLGWRSDTEDLPFGTRSWAAYAKNLHHISFAHPRKSCTIELHWRGLWDVPGQVEGLWSRRIDSNWEGLSCARMAPGDLLLYLCEHGSNHAWFRAKWLGDLARILCLGSADWHSAFESARSAQSERPMLLALRLLKDVYGLSGPALLQEAANKLPSFLVKTATVQLKTNRDELVTPASLRSLGKRLRHLRYDRLLRPYKSWRQTASELYYCRDDFRLGYLPERLFWVLYLTRPFLWFWRFLHRKPAAHGVPAAR